VTKGANWRSPEAKYKCSKDTFTVTFIAALTLVLLGTKLLKLSVQSLIGSPSTLAGTYQSPRRVICVHSTLAKTATLQLYYLDTILRQDGRVSNMIFYYLIFGSVETANIHLLNNWLNTLMTIDGHVVSLELSLACLTLRTSPPSNLPEKTQPRGGRHCHLL